MSSPLFRLRVSGSGAKFQALAIAPGQLLLDRWNTNDKLLADWLGRFVAKADWQNNAFAFFLRNDQKQQLADIVCQPARVAELHGLLKRELSDLQDCLRKSKPSASEQPLYDYVCRGLVESDSFAALKLIARSWMNAQSELRNS